MDRNRLRDRQVPEMTRRTAVLTGTAGILGGAALGACGPAARGSQPASPGVSAASPGAAAGGASTAPQGTDDEGFDPREIITVLPRDAIPAIMDPRFLSAEEAARVYRPDEVVLALDREGDARAYSTELLSSHEIVNDTVGGAPVAVTW